MFTKLSFNQGGQPVFLGDLSLLQSNPLDQYGLLIKTLGGGSDVFLLNSMNGSIVSSDVANNTTTFKIAQNWIVKSGVIYELPETTVTVPSWDTPMYAGFTTTQSDVRTFEDGQTHECLETTQAYLSLEKTSNDMYNVFELKTLFEIMAPLVKAKEPVIDYKNLTVSLYNGYTGIVEYKEDADMYKIRVKLTSNNTAWGADSGAIFGFTPASIPFLKNMASMWFTTGGDSPSRVQKAVLAIRDGGAYLEGLDLTSDINTPILCPVSTFFIIPK